MPGSKETYRQEEVWQKGIFKDGVAVPDNLELPTREEADIWLDAYQEFDKVRHILSLSQRLGTPSLTALYNGSNVEFPQEYDFQSNLELLYAAQVSHGVVRKLSEKKEPAETIAMYTLSEERVWKAYVDKQLRGNPEFVNAYRQQRKLLLVMQGKKKN